MFLVSQNISNMLKKILFVCSRLVALMSKYEQFKNVYIKISPEQNFIAFRVL